MFEIILLEQFLKTKLKKIENSDNKLLFSVFFEIFFRKIKFQQNMTNDFLINHVHFLSPYFLSSLFSLKNVLKNICQTHLKIIKKKLFLFLKTQFKRQKTETMPNKLSVFFLFFYFAFNLIIAVCFKKKKYIII